VQVALEVGARGQFDVMVDDEVVASKQRIGVFARLLGADGFPDVEATVDAVSARLSEAR
jgi:predicted Rdx family selenoprotein